MKTSFNHSWQTERFSAAVVAMIGGAKESYLASQQLNSLRPDSVPGFGSIGDSAV